MTSLYTTKTNHNMCNTFERYFVDARTKEYHLTQTEARFAGLKLTQHGYSISDSAIAKFPTPSTRTDLRSFCGLVNQLASSTNSLSTVLAPLRPLLSSRNDFLWTPVHDEAFVQAKHALTTTPTLAYFNPTKDTCLHTDASRLGLGSYSCILNGKSCKLDPDF